MDGETRYCPVARNVLLASVDPAPIVSGMVRDRVAEPLTASTVIDEVPTAAVGETVNVSKLRPAPVNEVEENDAFTPVGRLLADNTTLPVKPELTEIEFAPEVPWSTVIEVKAAVTV